MTTSTTGPTSRSPLARAALRTAGVVVFWLAVWQALVWAVHSDVLLASPLQTAVQLVELVPTADFWASVGFSASRIVAGFLLALVAGSALAAAAAAWPVVDMLLSPFIRALRAVPVVSFVLLVLIWASSGALSVVIGFIMVMPVVYANIAEGIAARDPLLDELAQVFRLDARRRWWAITLPRLMPYLTASVRVGLGLCWKAGVSAEVIGLTSGSIGERLYQAKLLLSTADLFAWTAVIIVCAWVLEKLALTGLRAADRRLGKAYSRP